MAGVVLEHVSKMYERGVRALADTCLTIGDREFVVLVGPSGCGKSTLLRIIAGLEEVTTGEVWIGDRMVNPLPPRDRDVAMVFQNYALYPHMTARDNIAFALKVRRYPRAEIATRVDRAAALLNISALLAKMPRELSGGERQRVAVGRAIVRDPQVYLFDEPLSNLDAQLRASMRAEIAALHRRLQVTTIYVTHDQVEAMTMGQRIVVMKDGVVQQQGPPLEVYDRPANRFVAGFIGSPAMNQIPVRVTEDGRQLQLGGTQRSLPAHLPSLAGRSLILGLRAEHVAPSGEEGLPARVTLLEPIGGDAFVSCESDAGPLVLRTRGEAGVAAGAPLHVSFDLSHAHYFDPDTGNRITPP